MIDISIKKPQKSLTRSKPSAQKIKIVSKWSDVTDDPKSHQNSDTDLSLTQKDSVIECRSISPLERTKTTFSALSQILNPKSTFGIHQSIQQPNQKYKTELCKNFDIYGYCKWGDNCFFAHSKSELKSKTMTTQFYKTKVCKNYHTIGFCPYASKCQYFHFKGYMIYQELLNSFETKVGFRFNESEQKLEKMLSKFERLQPRLKIFEKMARGDGQRSLLEKFADNEF